MLPAKLLPVGYRGVAARETDKLTCACVSAIPRITPQRLRVNNHRRTCEQLPPSLELCRLLLLSLKSCSIFFLELISAVSDSFNNFVLRGASCSSCSTTGLLYDRRRCLGSCRSNLRSHRYRRSGLMHRLCSSFDFRILNLAHHRRHSCYCLCNILPVHADLHSRRGFPAKRRYTFFFVYPQLSRTSYLSQNTFPRLKIPGD